LKVWEQNIYFGRENSKSETNELYVRYNMRTKKLGPKRLGGLRYTTDKGVDDVDDVGWSG
jgi:hypothetical protein